MKKTVSAILLTGVFAAMPAMVAAASQEEAKTEPSKEIVLNKFKDNWMISLEGGVDFSLGLSCNSWGIKFSQFPSCIYLC